MKDVEKVDLFMENLEHPQKNEIELLRDIIKSNWKISEKMKENAPSYYYKKDMATFNLYAKNYVRLVFLFPNGIIEDDLLEGKYRDRRMAKFYGMDDIKFKRTTLKKVVDRWVRMMDRSVAL